MFQILNIVKVAYATTTEVVDVDTLVQKVNSNIINPLIKLMFALAFLVFVWGVFQFLMNKQDEKNVTAGKQHMIWGVIGMAIMFSAFGIINLIVSTIGSV